MPVYRWPFWVSPISVIVLPFLSVYCEVFLTGVTPIILPEASTDLLDHFIGYQYCAGLGFDRRFSFWCGSGCICHPGFTGCKCMLMSLAFDTQSRRDPTESAGDMSGQRNGKADCGKWYPGRNSKFCYCAGKCLCTVTD